MNWFHLKNKLKDIVPQNGMKKFCEVNKLFQLSINKLRVGIWWLTVASGELTGNRVYRFTDNCKMVD